MATTLKIQGEHPNQLRVGLVVFPMIYQVLYIPGFRFSEASTVALIPFCAVYTNVCDFHVVRSNTSRMMFF